MSDPELLLRDAIDDGRTALVSAFRKPAPGRDQIRIVYGAWADAGLGRPGMATFLQGRGDRRSRSTILRQLQRWTRTSGEVRSVTKRDLGKVRALAGRGLTLWLRADYVRVCLDGELGIAESDDPGDEDNDYCRDRECCARIPRADFAPVLEAYEKQDWPIAWIRLLDAFRKHYDDVPILPCGDGLSEITLSPEWSR